MSTINLLAPTVYVDAVLIGDPRSVTGGSNDVPPVMTQVASVNVSAALEIQSTVAGLLLPRMTTAQMNAIVTPVAGLMIFNSTTATPHVYSAGSWVSDGSVSSLTPANSNIVLTPNPIVGAGTIGLSATLTGITLVSGNSLTLRSTVTGITLDAPTASGVSLTSAAGSVPLRFYNSAGTFYVAFVGGNSAASTTFTLPLADGTAGQVLSTNGAGTLSWINN